MVPAPPPSLWWHTAASLAIAPNQGVAVSNQYPAPPWFYEGASVPQCLHLDPRGWITQLPDRLRRSASALLGTTERPSCPHFSKYAQSPSRGPSDRLQHTPKGKGSGKRGEGPHSSQEVRPCKGAMHGRGGGPDHLRRNHPPSP